MLKFIQSVQLGVVKMSSFEEEINRKGVASNVARYMTIIVMKSLKIINITEEGK